MKREIHTHSAKTRNSISGSARKWGHKALLAGLILMSTRAAWSQNIPPAGTSPSGVAKSAATISLSLKRAVELALAPDGNTRLQLAEDLVRQSRSRAAQARGGLLPNLDGTFSAANKTINLAAMGISFKGPILGLITSPELVGPFNTVDVRASASMNLLDLSVIRRYQSARSTVASAENDRKNTEEEVVALVARSYLMAQRQQESVKAIQSNVTLAESLLQLARNRKEAGTATGIDLTRAQVQLANEQQRLLVAQNDQDAARLQLMRAIGMDLSGGLELTDPFPADTIKSDSAELSQALPMALSTRTDYLAQLKREESARLSYSSVKWERLPSLAGYGDYGSIGNTTDHLIPTRTYGVIVRVPIFDGARRDARRGEAAALWHQEQVKSNDLRQQIELELRLALDRLHSASQQLQVAQEGLKLSETEMEQAQRRYEAGVTNSIEVTDAQTRLARARDNQVAAAFLHEMAKIDRAQAMGDAKSKIQ
jgi:outer membrane protein